MKKVFTLIMVLCLVFALAACGSGAEEPGAAEEPNATDDAGASGEAVELIMSIGTGQNLKDGAARFKELVEEASGGTIIVTIFPDSVLGDDRVATETTQFGDIDISVCSTSQSAGVYSNLLAFDAPFLFRSTEEVDEIMDGEAAKAILDGMESVGLKGLAYWENGFRNLTNDTREVRVPSDLEGLKIRTMENEVVLATWEAFGANPTPMAFAEVYPGLQQGTIDGQENSLSVIFANGLQEVQEYISLTQHLYSPFVVFMNLDKFNSLSAEQQQIIMDAAAETTPYQREISRQYDDEILEAMREEGNVISELTLEEKNEWLAVVEEANIFDMIKESMDNPEMFDALLE